VIELLQAQYLRYGVTVVGVTGGFCFCEVSEGNGGGIFARDGGRSGSLGGISGSDGFVEHADKARRQSNISDTASSGPNTALYFDRLSRTLILQILLGLFCAVTGSAPVKN
jgi:hypothetical protein